MALAERTLASNTNASGASSVTSISVTPTGQQENDWVIVLVIAVGGTASFTNSAGGLSRAHAADLTQGTTTTIATWKKKCGPSESGTTYTFTIPTGRRMAVAVRCYSGGDGTDIVRALGALEGVNAQSIDLDSVDIESGDWHLLLTASNSANGGSVNFDPPAGYTEKHDFASTHGTSANACLGWSEDESPSDPTGVQTVGITGGVNRQIAGGSIVLKAASGTAVTGSGTGAFGGLGTATGRRGVTGTAAQSFGGLGIATGRRGVLGSAAGTFGGFGTALGVPGEAGAGVGAFGGLGVATGRRGVLGAAVGTFGGLGTALGTVGPILPPSLRLGDVVAVSDRRGSVVPARAGAVGSNRGGETRWQ